MLLKQSKNPYLFTEGELIQQFYGSAPILMAVMNAQTLYVSQGLGIVHGLQAKESVLSSHFSRYRYAVRMPAPALDVSSAANQDTKP